jgi:hypothetical protein
MKQERDTMTTSLVERLRASAEEVAEFPHPSQCDHLHDATAVMKEAAAELTRLQAELDAAREALANLVSAIDLNSGREPSISLYDRSLDNARAAIKETKA